MKVAVNLRLLVPGRIGGMEGYVRALLGQMLEYDPALELELLVTRENYATFDYSTDRVEKTVLQKNNFGRQISSFIAKNGVDLYFCPLLALEPLVVHVPSVVTIPDVQHEYYPEFFSSDVLEWRRINYRASVSVSSAVLTLSRFSADSIIEKYEAPAEKVYPIHLAADGVYSVELDYGREKSIKKKYHLPDEYGYFPANTWPHKNHKALLQALSLYKKKYGRSLKIVFTGARDTGHKDLMQTIASLGLQNDVLFLGYIPKEEMQYIYKNATFLVFPSLFEGFGMPVLEAMLSDCPVICSRATSLPEIAGDAALYFDPLSPENLAQAMGKIIRNTDLRRSLIEKGRAQGGGFSWRKTAEETLAVFERLIEEKHASGRQLVSVVTPSYNQGEFIEDTILSVLSQSYDNVEYMVMDGGSQDNTVETLTSYADKIKWVSESDNGQADAVNKGFEAANGDILGWLNSDDTYLPRAIERVARYFEQHPKTVMVYGNAFYIDRDGLLIESYPTEKFRLKRLSENCFICQPAVFIRSTILGEVGKLNTDLRTCMDFDFWIRIGKRFEGQIDFIDDCLATSRMYSENKTTSMRKVVYDEIVATVRRHFGIVPNTWLYGYIVDVIDGVLIKRNRFYKVKPLRALLHWLYVMRLAFYIGKPTPLLIALGRSIKTTIGRDHEHYIRYSDGWVSKGYIVELEPQSETYLIKVSGKHQWPYRRPLTISVQINDKKAVKKTIRRKGEFFFSIDPTKHLSGTGRVKVFLEPNKTFVPSKHGLSEDKRFLSFVLEKIEVLPK